MKTLSQKQLVVASAVVLAWSAAHAGEKEDLETLRQTTIGLIQALVQSGLIPQERADSLMRDAKNAAAERNAAQAIPGDKVVRVPYVPEHVRKEIKDELRKEIVAEARDEGWAKQGAVPEWVGQLKLETDIRLRFQQDRFPTKNLTPDELTLISVEDGGPVNVNNSQSTNTRLRLRARFGAELKMSEALTMGGRIVTGSGANPVSTTQTLGNDFNRLSIYLDRAFLKLTPVEWLAFTGGRIANPFFNTDLIWAPDLSFDGGAVAMQAKFAEQWSAFQTLGAFPVEEIEPNFRTSSKSAAKSKWLFGYQAGVAWAPQQSNLKVAVGLYDYQNVHGIRNTLVAGNDSESRKFDATAMQFRQKGNSLFSLVAEGDTRDPYSVQGLASKFRELSITGSADFAQFEPVHVVLTGEYVKNIGFKRREILARTGRDIKPKTTGYAAQMRVGMPRLEKPHDWQVFGGYKYLERDAVLDAFADPDFRLGGTDSKGYVIGASYGIAKNTWLSLKWTSADPISGPPFSVDLLQFELNGRF